MTTDDAQARRDEQLADPADPAEELASLVGGLRSHLQWLAGQGATYVLAGPSPRSSASVEQQRDAALEQQRDVADQRPSDAAARDPGSGDPGSGDPAAGDLAAGDLAAGDLALLSDPGGGAAGLALIRDRLGDCRRCRLSEDRVQVVFGQGNPEADLMFVGEAPGRDEDLQGQAFVGAAGQLLTKMIKAMGYSRDEVFIGNIIKCRPPRNRNPEPDEIACCEPFLLAQIRAIDPRVIITLGRFATQTLLQTDQSMGRMRGRLHRFSLDGRERVLLATYHPAYLLRNPEAKRPVWEDLKLVMAWFQDHVVD